MLSKSLSTSEKFASVSGHLVEFCHALYPLLISHTDDFGRLQGDPFTVKHQCYPASVRTLDDFADALLELHRVELIRWYVVGGKRYLQIDNFDPHQLGLHKRTRSRFPEVPGSSGKVPEIPSEEKGREQEEKGREQEPVPARAAPALVSPARVQAAQAAAVANGKTHAKTKAALAGQVAELRAGFEEFMAHYPKGHRVGKLLAWKAWQKLRPSLVLKDLIVASVDEHKAWPTWLKDGGDFIPHPTTFLNQARWEDEPPVRGPTPEKAMFAAPTQADVEAQLEILRRR